ncbi:phosphotransferase family protein [Streptomyces marincola]|uniref:phosphotransferase family protein n=1 Tax=Streptomyces marincola TaxID=2878388 RepID=UPI001CF52E47|nr:phosphotransferase [Streptomyces marincola]UCM89032.1 aminoglycoside phosphotransferase family protein [Streptomyces marincola]
MAGALPADYLARLAATAGTGEPVLLADRPDGTVVRIGDVVAKAHAADSDAAALAVRVGAAAHPALAHVLLPPLPPGGLSLLHDGRPASLWPLGTPVDPAAVPWEAAGALLAALHAVPPAAVPGPLPPAGGPARAARALADLTGTPTDPAYAAVREAAARILSAMPAPRPVALCHGDFHLGQLVRRRGAEGAWRLIDVDDLGVGDPAWDLARPAAWFAAGLLPAQDWLRLLNAYQAAAGTEGEDPWPALDAPARVATAQQAARALVRAARRGVRPGEEDEALFDSCLRIAALP